MADWLVHRSERVVINYHSITPPSYFERWSNWIARLQVGALQELTLLAPRATLGIAVSRFDEAELRAAGCTATTVIPVANVSVPPIDPDQDVLAWLSARGPGSGHRWLSVGRLAPNKGHHQTIAALFAARATTDPEAHLTVVGSPSETAYASALRRFARSLGIGDSVEFVSGISDAALAAYYQWADVLVMLSDHEGFGVPLVEAMGRGLPVIAFDSGAVKEVLGESGVLLEHKHPQQVADAVAELLGDPAEQERLVEAGRARCAEMDLGSAADRLVEALTGVANPAPPG
jgi:glycosyltransferase involved in cell wall biosynthesis